MTAPPATEFDAVLARMFNRDGLDTLPAALAENCGITVTKMTKLDVGVFRVDRGKEAPLVARLFSRARPQQLAEGDLAVLQYLAQVGFPAERPFGDNPLTAHEGQALLVTEFVAKVPKDQQPKYPITRLGARIGRLHTLPVPPGADRPAGALHHYAEGTMSDELRAAASWLDGIRERAPDGAAAAAMDELRAQLKSADGGDGLPEALVHPDPVPSNAVFTAIGPVLVDWTSAGRGPRLASLSLVLRSGWAAAPFLRGYFKSITLTGAERDRLAAVMIARALINRTFGVCHDPSTAVAAVRKLPALRDQCEEKAAELLSAAPAT